MPVRFSQERLNVWMYKFLLGTLSRENVWILKNELERREKQNQIHSALERKLLAAFANTEADEQEVRVYLAQLLNDWAKRNWAD